MKNSFQRVEQVKSQLKGNIFGGMWLIWTTIYYGILRRRFSLFQVALVKYLRLDHWRERFIWACAEGTTYVWSPCFLTKRESWSQSCPNSLIVQVGGVSRAWSAPESSTQHQLWVCELRGTIHTPAWQTPCALGFSEFSNVSVSKLYASRIGPGTVCRKAIKRPPRLFQST